MKLFTDLKKNTTQKSTHILFYCRLPKVTCTILYFHPCSKWFSHLLLQMKGDVRPWQLLTLEKHLKSAKSVKAAHWSRTASFKEFLDPNGDADHTQNLIVQLFLEALLNYPENFIKNRKQLFEKCCWQTNAGKNITSFAEVIMSIEKRRR